MWDEIPEGNGGKGMRINGGLWCLQFVSSTGAVSNKMTYSSPEGNLNSPASKKITQSAAVNQKSRTFAAYRETSCFLQVFLG